MGATSLLVRNGVNLGALREGLSKFSQNLASVERNKQKWQKFSQKPGSSEKEKKWFHFCYEKWYSKSFNWEKIILFLMLVEHIHMICSCNYTYLCVDMTTVVMTLISASKIVKEFHFVVHKLSLACWLPWARWQFCILFFSLKWSIQENLWCIR